MNKSNDFKIAFLFIVFLCLISFSVIELREDYFNYTSQNLYENVMDVLKNEKVNEKNILPDGAVGVIIIPSIGVNAPIYEGTSADVLKYSVRSF